MKWRWKWVFAGAGASLLVLTLFLALWANGKQNAARHRAARELDGARDAAGAVLHDLFTEAQTQLAGASPDAPAPIPFADVSQEHGAGTLSETVPVEDPAVWAHFGRARLRVYILDPAGGPADFLLGRIPLDELRERLANDKAVGPVLTVDEAIASKADPKKPKDRDERKRFARLLIIERNGDVAFRYEDAVAPDTPVKGRSSARGTPGMKAIESEKPSARDEDGSPPSYRDASDKRVIGSWGPVPGASKLWILAEVRDADVVAGVAGWHLEFMGWEIGEASPWHIMLGLGLLLLVASTFFFITARDNSHIGVLLRVYTFARPYAWGIAAAVAVGAVYGAARAYRAFIAKSLVDDVLVDAGPEAEAAIWRIVWATVGLGLITAVANYFKEYLQNYYSTAMMADIRVALARKIVSLPLSFFNRMRSGELVARIERDVTGMRQVLMQVFEKAFVQPFTLVAAIVIAFMMNWRLALVLFGLPIIVLPVFRIAKRIKKRAEKRQNLVADISHVLFQMLTGIKVVKAFHGEEREAARLDRANRRFIHEARRISRLSAFSDSLLDFLQMVGGAIVVAAGGYGVLRGEVEVGDLVGFVVVILSVYDASKDIVSVLNKLIESLPSVQRVYDIFDTPNDLKDGPRVAPPGPLERGIELRGVRFKYLENDILKGVDLTIPAGKVVAIVGPTGAGKTTLCDLVARFYDPTEGQVLWDGVDAREYTVGSLAGKLGIVTQDAFLFNAPVDENIRYGREDATKAEVEAAAQDSNVHDEILQMEGGYSKMAGERGMSLSGGQRQRVTIARALLKDAPVLILDEATSNLDSLSEQRVQAALAKLMKGRTVIVVAHRLSTIRNADKVVVVDGGVILEQGSPEELLRKPDGHFRAMYQRQMGEGGGEA